MNIKNRKAHIALLTVILTLAIAISAFHFYASAATAAQAAYPMEEIEAYLNAHGEEHYAYMDLDQAEEALKPVILEARWRIISRASWVADDINGYIADEAGNIIEIVPHFHDIFPADWEIQPGRGLY